jgi:hypothetical protein
MRRAGVLLASMVAVGATFVFAGSAGAETSPNGSDDACIGAKLSHLAEYYPDADGIGVIGTRAEIYHAAAVDPEFWDQYGVDPGNFGNDPDLSVSSVARDGLLDSDFLYTFSGC